MIGLTGSHGLNSATTQHITRRCKHRHSKWFMVGHHRTCCHTPQDMPALRWLMLFWPGAMSSWKRSTDSFSRHNSTLGASTMLITVPWSMLLLTGYCYVCSTIICSPWFLAKAASWDPSMLALFKCLNTLVRWPGHLQLPDDARIHDVLHVRVLKQFQGTLLTSQPVLPPLRHGRPLLHLEWVLRCELHRGVWHVLVEWSGLPVWDATWELVLGFRQAYPSFQLMDELFPKGGEMLW